MEAAPGFEPGYKGFADLCLGHLAMPPKSGKRDLNPRLQPWQGYTLPLSYSRFSTFYFNSVILGNFFYFVNKVLFPFFGYWFY